MVERHQRVKRCTQTAMITPLIKYRAAELTFPNNVGFSFKSISLTGEAINQVRCCKRVKSTISMVILEARCFRDH